MPILTRHYGLEAHTFGDYYSASVDQRRFTAIDSQLGLISDIIGPGIIDGWDIQRDGPIVDFTFKITTTGWVGTVDLESSPDDFVTSTIVQRFTSSNKVRTLEATELDTDVKYRINVTTHTTGDITASLVVQTNSADGQKEPGHPHQMK